MGGIYALPAEDCEVAKRVGLPERCTAARPGFVFHERLAQGKALDGIQSVLVYVRGSLPPNPLAGTVLVFPNVIQESGRIRGNRAVSPTAEEPKILG